MGIPKPDWFSIQRFQSKYPQIRVPPRVSRPIWATFEYFLKSDHHLSYITAILFKTSKFRSELQKASEFWPVTWLYHLITKMIKVWYSDASGTTIYSICLFILQVRTAFTYTKHWNSFYYQFAIFIFVNLFRSTVIFLHLDLFPKVKFTWKVSRSHPIMCGRLTMRKLFIVQ